MGLYKGVMHVHSTYSYDGKLTLDEIAGYATERGYDFIALSEHSEDLNSEIMPEYIKDCQKASSERCLLIPGVEFSCENNLHILGYGMNVFTDSIDPFTVSEFITNNHGVAVIAHPSRYNYEIPPLLACRVHGIEIWNSAYDGRFIPNDRSIELLLNSKNGDTLPFAFAGLDFHRPHNRKNVEIIVECDGFNSEYLLSSLKIGNFSIVNPFFRLNAICDTNMPSLAKIKMLRFFYTLAKACRNKLFGKI